MNADRHLFEMKPPEDADDIDAPPVTTSKWIAHKTQAVSNALEPSADDLVVKEEVEEMAEG